MLTWAGLVFAVAQGAADGNVLRNPSFETPTNKPLGWDTRTFGGHAEFEYVQHDPTGNRCIRISSATGADAAWFRTAVVDAYAVYRLSGWIKTGNVIGISGEGALLNLHYGPSAKTEALTGTQDWTHVAVEFETGATESVTINCLLGGWGQASGTAWFDDLSLERVGDQPLSPSIAIDVSKTGPPVSPYIYGQFIEHLGRCIYGGIWAEMLEDRKYFYAVDAEESPWRATVDGSVAMVAEGSYVGDLTPRVQNGGLAQGSLGLVDGKKYEGRVVLAGDGPVEVTLIWGDGPKDRETKTIKRLSHSFEKYPFKFRAGASTDEGELIVSGPNAFQVGTVSLMPADNVNGMRADTLALLKELDAPVYRWPGGNFVSGYDWRDGIGDPDRRPPRKNPAWEGIEHNDFGIHEFMAFCEELGTEPYIAVNSGLGSVDDARAELEYVNGDAHTAMGLRRKQNGRAEPWGVNWWGIGNEMYGDWQLGHMPLDDYAQKHNAFAQAMRDVDPSITLIGVGATGPWSETMLAQCADQMELLSEHFYCTENPGLLEHVRQIPDAVRYKADAHREYWAEIPSLKDNPIRIALDEYNYWYGPYIYGELGTQYYLQDALGIAAGIHEMTRNADVFQMANYAQTVNVIGCIKTSKTAAAFDTTGLVLKLYRRHYGVTPLDISGDVGPLDVAAAWNADRSGITIGVVNPTQNELDLTIQIPGVRLAGKGTLWRITGPDRMAFNRPGAEPSVEIREETIRDIEDTLSIIPLSISLFEIRTK
jgi:alpha-N-arabinofuranosidase